MVGIELRFELRPEMRQELSCQMQQRQEINQQLALTQRISLELYFEMQDFFSGLYGEAKKKTYDKHGLHFEYAVVKKKDLPKKMLDCGPGFTIFSCDSEGNVNGAMLFVVEDYVPYAYFSFLEMVAVHEYGEGLMLGHKEASILEWGMAKREGCLRDYLNWVETNFPSKLADMEQMSLIFDVMPEEVYESAKERAKDSEEAKIVLEIMRGFDFPEEARQLVEKYEHTRKVILSAISQVSFDSEALLRDPRGNAYMARFLAAYVFHYTAAAILKRNMDKVASASEQVEKEWKEHLSRVNSTYSGEAAIRASNIGSALPGSRSEERAESIKEYLEYFSRNFLGMLPCRLKFAVEIARIIREEGSGAARQPEEAIKAKLGKAFKLAKGLVNITEVQCEEGGGAKTVSDRDADMLRFYIQVLLFEAAREVVEGCPGMETDKKLNSMFRRKVQDIEREFKNLTSKKLFISPEAPLWTDLSYLASVARSTFVQKVGEKEDVKKFVGPKPEIAGLRKQPIAAA